MKISNLLFCSIFFSVIALAISGCSSNNTAGGQVNPNTVGTPFTLKYEIISSSSITTPTTIQYINGTGQLEQDNSFTSGTTWSKEVTVTTSSRPFYVVLSTGLALNSTSTGTGNIYVNGNRVAHLENPTLQATNTVQIIMNYWIQ